MTLFFNPPPTIRNISINTYELYVYSWQQNSEKKINPYVLDVMGIRFV